MDLETFIIHKKVINLIHYAEIRENKGEPYDIEARIKFNWPTLNAQESQRVLEAYNQRRQTDMGKTKPRRKARNQPPENEVTLGQKPPKRPSPPSRPAKYVIRCELGERLYIEAFIDPGEAKLFIDLILKPKEEPFKWVSDTQVTSKGGILKVSCEELEELMEIDDEKKAVRMEEPIISQIAAFLRGKWEKKVNSGAAPPKTITRTPSVVSQRRRVNTPDPDMMTIQQICEANGWEPRVARGKMRDAGWQIPESGSWRWPKKEAPAIEAKLKALMKK